MSSRSGMNPYSLIAMGDVVQIMLAFFQRPPSQYRLSVNTVRLRRRCRELGIRRIPRVTLVHRSGDSAGWWGRDGIVINALGLIQENEVKAKNTNRFMQVAAEHVFLHELRHAWQNEHRSGWFFQNFTWPIVCVASMLGLWGLILPSLSQGAVTFGTVASGLLLGGLNFLAATLFLNHVDYWVVYPRRLCERDARQFVDANVDNEKWKGIIHLRRVS